MRGLAAALSRLVSGELGALGARVRLTVLLALGAGLAGVVGLGFLVAAAFMAVVRSRGPIEARLWFGAGFVLLCAVGLLVLMLAERRAKAARERRRKAEAAAVGAAALAALPELLRGQTGKDVLGAAALAAAAYAVYREHVRPDDG